MRRLQIAFGEKRKLPARGGSLGALLFKCGLGLAILIVLANQLSDEVHLVDSLGDLHPLWIYVLWALLLVPVNWALESKKWLMGLNLPVFTFRKAVKQVLQGQSLGLLTPLGIGDYGGRIIGLKAEERAAGLRATLLSSLAQNLVTWTLGFIALIWFVSRHRLAIEPGYLLFVVVVLGVLLSVYLKFSDGMELIFEKWQKWVQPLTKISNLVSMRVLILALFRYAIYLTQYTLVLYAFDVPLSLTELIPLVSLVFFVLSGLPLPGVFSPLIRVKAAILIFSYEVDSELLIATSALLVWIANVVLPSLAGTYLLLIRKAESNEETTDHKRRPSPDNILLGPFISR